MPIPYKSFCWNLGTTSFRTKNFNKTIEQQLLLLNDFWNLPKNKAAVWNGNNSVQSAYYDYMQEKGFVEGAAKNKPKDAREKTSGLVEIGLITQDRHLTESGRKLLNISLEGNFDDDNAFQIQKDSMIFTQQLLKTSSVVAGYTVRPLVVLVYVLSKLETLSFQEFMYLLPLCINQGTTQEILGHIQKLRSGQETIEDIIFNRLIEIDNYQQAQTMFLKNTVTENLICEIGLNRKSRKYDKSYYFLYLALKNVFLDKDISKVPMLYQATRGISSTSGKHWLTLLFNKFSEKNIIANPEESLNDCIFSSVQNETDLKKAFFKVMHVNKTKATLYDYFDLNRRYFKLTDLILFHDDKVEFDLIPKSFFVPIADCLYLSAFESHNDLDKVTCLEQISPCLTINESAILDGINQELGTNANNLVSAREIIKNERLRRFNLLIDRLFTDDKIQDLLTAFQTRDDSFVQETVTDNADVPTIFEYILGILWYKVSERKGNVLEYMKLSLDADLLPKTHAAGGEADIVYEYEASDYYPQHCLLIEATLADATNQRRMEMEPVSRHLGDYLIRTRNNNSYCIFATNHLDPNVISDFRLRKNATYYSRSDQTQTQVGMKIIPLEIDVLKAILALGLTYKDLYHRLDEVYQIEGSDPVDWYYTYIKKAYVNLN